MAKTSPKQQAANNFDALFGARQGERIVSGGFKMLSHDRITVRPQVRRTFPKGEMDELRGSIRELRAQNGGIEATGVLQALLVCPDGEGYRLIAGEKRFRATQSEGLSEVPCVVVPAVSEGMVRLLQLTENAQRSAPPVLEEAGAMRETMDEQKLSLRDMARMMGKTLGYITNRLAVLKMAPDVQEMVAQRSDTLKHAPLIEAVQDEAQRAELIRAVVENGLSVKELERRLRPEEESIRPSFGGHPEFDRSSITSTRSQVLPHENNNGTANPHAAEEDAAPDAIKNALLPARSFIAEAERLLKGRVLSYDYRAEMNREIAKLEKQIAQLKKGHSVATAQINSSGPFSNDLSHEGSTVEFRRTFADKKNNVYLRKKSYP